MQFRNACIASKTASASAFLRGGFQRKIPVVRAAIKELQFGD